MGDSGSGGFGDWGRGGIRMPRTGIAISVTPLSVIPRSLKSTDPFAIQALSRLLVGTRVFKDARDSRIVKRRIRRRRSREHNRGVAGGG
jgi:hypothetical protein